LDFLRLPIEPFARAPKTSIDYAVMERTKRAAVVPINCGWSDVGSWNAVWDILNHDVNGNAAIALSYSMTATTALRARMIRFSRHRGRRSTRRGPGDLPWKGGAGQRPGRVESTAGRGAFADLSTVGLLPRRGHGFALSSETDRGEADAKLSLQRHFHRAEHWVVVRGTAEIEIGTETRIVHENESAYIPIGSIHRLANPGKIPLELIEVQVGSYLARTISFASTTSMVEHKL
jgi:mannose-1-phosphate guanylyltransferase / mannose-6-phosphate isomerase